MTAATLPSPTTLPGAPTPTAAKGQQIAEATVVLDLVIRGMGFTRKIDSESVTPEGTDAALIHAYKDLIDRKEIKDLNTLKSRFTTWLSFRAVDCSMLRNGTYLLPLSLVEQTDRRIEQFITERAALVEQLLAKYDDIKAAAQARLGPQFTELDYPPADVIRRAFTVEARYLTFNVPQALENLNRELFAREKAKVERQWAEAGEEIRQALREGFAGMVEQFSRQLGTDPETGKPRKLSENGVTQMKDFLDTFAARNLTNDAELAKLVERAKNLMLGIESKDDIKRSTDLRASMRESFTSIKATLDTMVSTRTRAFSFGEDV